MGTAVDVTISATDSDATQTLSYSLTEVPALPTSDDLAITPATAASGAAVAITGTFTAPFTGTVTVTATDSYRGDGNRHHNLDRDKHGDDNPAREPGGQGRAPR